jgi:hypothetical protein
MWLNWTQQPPRRVVGRRCPNCRIHAVVAVTRDERAKLRAASRREATDYSVPFCQRANPQAPLPSFDCSALLPAGRLQHV